MCYRVASIDDKSHDHSHSEGLMRTKAPVEQQERRFNEKVEGGDKIASDVGNLCVCGY